jgi:uncharacterized protein involved in cysteine biosynthesis
MPSHSPNIQSAGFFYGVRALFQGIYLFWTHPRWWGWALLPTLAILFLAIATWKGVFILFQDVFEFRLTLSYILAYVVTLGSLYLLFPVLYESLGGLFFDGLTQRVYRDVLQKQITTPSFRVNFQYALRALGYSCRTLLLAIPLFFILLIPWVGILVWSVIFGYRFGISYLFSGGLMRGETIQETLLWARANRKAVAGFGISAFLILSYFPFIGLLFVPSFVVAAVCIREELHANDFKRQLLPKKEAK